VRVSDYDCIVFIGGVGATVYFDDPLAHSIASEAAAAGKVVAAICVSPVTLARAGVLQGRRATVFPDYAAELENAGAMYTGEDVTVDGRIITANGPGAAEKFMWKIAEALV
jgi:protease I